MTIDKARAALGLTRPTLYAQIRLGALTARKTGRRFDVSPEEVERYRRESRRRPPLERFWAKVDKNGPVPAHRPDLGPCWIWTSTQLPDGYGLFWPGPGSRRSARAHRYSWELMHGPIPAGLWACHHCDNPPCVNPGHLFLGAQTDNVRDMITKRRDRRGDGSAGHKWTRSETVGTANPSAKLTEADVLAIRARLAGGETAAAIAGDFPVSEANVNNIRNRRIWTHI